MNDINHFWQFFIGERGRDTCQYKWWTFTAPPLPVQRLRSINTNSLPSSCDCGISQPLFLQINKKVAAEKHEVTKGAETVKVAQMCEFQHTLRTEWFLSMQLQ